MLLFAALGRLGEERVSPTPSPPAKLTIGFIQKKIQATPAAPRTKPPATRQQKSETRVTKPARPPRLKQPAVQQQRNMESAETRETEQPEQTVAAPISAEQKQQDMTLAEPVPVYQLTGLPRFIHKEKPVYPASLRHQGKEATVKLEIYIDANGQIRNIKLLKSGGRDFDQAAINAIRASTFAPGNVNGKPVPVLMRMPIRFKLR